MIQTKSMQLTCNSIVLVGEKVNGTVSLDTPPQRPICVVLSLDATRNGRNTFHKSLLVRNEDFCLRNGRYEATFSIRVPQECPLMIDGERLSHTLCASSKAFGRRYDSSETVALKVRGHTDPSSHAQFSQPATRPASARHARTFSLPLLRSSRRFSSQPLSRLQEEAPDSPDLTATIPSTPGSPGSLCDSEWSFPESGATTPRSFEEPSAHLAQRSTDRNSFKPRHKKTFSIQSLTSLTDGRASAMARFARKLSFRHEEEDMEFACCGHDVLAEPVRPSRPPSPLLFATLPATLSAAPASPRRPMTRAEKRMGRLPLLEFDFGFDNPPAFEFDEADEYRI